MPAAAVIPAPIAYIKVAAVKKLVVGIYFSDRGVCAFKNKNFIFLPIHYMVARMVVNVFIYISSIARLKFFYSCSSYAVAPAHICTAHSN